MKNVYITGIAGLLGGNIAFLLKDKYAISGVDLVKVSIPNVNISIFDLLNFQQLKEDIVLRKPDIIIHCAALVNVDLCEENKELARQLNYQLTDFLTQLGNEFGIKIIYISTDAVFDGEKEGYYIENDLTNPINFYGISKLMGEQSVIKNPNNVVVRTNIYGFNIQQKTSFGEWVLYSLFDDKTLDMFYDIYYSPILVNDLANILDKIIANNIRGLFHVCSTGSISKYDFGINLKNTFQINTGFIRRKSFLDFNFKASRSRNMAMNNSKIVKLLGVNIRTPQESLVEFKQLYDQKYNFLIRGAICGQISN